MELHASSPCITSLSIMHACMHEDGGVHTRIVPFMLRLQSSAPCMPEQSQRCAHTACCRSMISGCHNSGIVIAAQELANQSASVMMSISLTSLLAIQQKQHAGLSFSTPPHPSPCLYKKIPNHLLHLACWRSENISHHHVLIRNTWQAESYRPSQTAKMSATAKSRLAAMKQQLNMHVQ